uniref:Dicer 1 n=2 Tax=Nematostella vectensis TaxID=45351 RepID=U3MHS9_NEMVE|nr:dicer 1 [Nematostella vectensis]
MSSDEEELSDAKGEAESKLLDGLTPRPYQSELVRIALEKNIIVCLGTGTGKTFISVMLIKELSFQVRKSRKEGGKRTFFLVNTVPLAKQQKEVIAKNTDLKVKEFIGDMGVDFWSDEQWKKELDDNQVLVMTAQIFLDLLGHARLRLSDVNLIVFDECHHARKGHPYKQIMGYFEESDYPRILGLTASIINTKETHKMEQLICELEATMRAACQTSDDITVSQFATRPEEIIYPYSNDKTEVEQDLNQLLVETVLNPWQEFVDDLRASGQKEVLKGVKSLISDCRQILDEMGASAANRVAEYFLKDLERVQGLVVANDDVIWLYQYCATQLRRFREIYSVHTIAHEVSEEDDLTHLLPKAKALVEILKQYGNPQASTPDISLCGIVFVERRYTAKILCEQLNIIATRDPSLEFIKCDFVVGHGASGINSSSDTQMGSTKQEKVLKMFRKHQINLLVATSVVEEGLDVPKCNFVVRFDFPQNFRSYVQSKGRARAKNSAFIVLVEDKDSEWAGLEVERYQETENYLQEKCQGRPLPTSEECEQANEDQYLQPYVTSLGARLTQRNSLSFLLSYCSKLPGDQYTRLMPEIITEEVEGAFRSTLMLPINCPLRDTIEGIVMPRKMLSRQAAAYEACKRLHQMGELDDNLRPVVSLSEESDEGTESEDDGKSKGKTGTKKRRRCYNRKIPDVLKESLPTAGAAYWFYSIDIKSPETRRAPVELGTLWNMGIMLRKPLPAIRRFQLFLDSGPVIVSIKPCDSTPTPSVPGFHLRIIEAFSRCLLSRALRMPLEVTADKLHGYHVVLLDSACKGIDLARMRDVERQMEKIDLPIRDQDALDSLASGDTIITPKHREKQQRYVLERVCPELNPTSPFPDRSKARTYAEYYEKTYDCHITDMHQPLLQVRNMSERINFLVNRKKQSRKKSNHVVHFIPELCSHDAIPASLLSNAQILPSVLHRMTSFLLAVELREKIKSKSDVIDEACAPENTLSVIGGVPASVIGRSLSPLRKKRSPPRVRSYDLFDKEFQEISQSLQAMFSNERTVLLHPDSELLLQALTTKSAGDAFDLERLEMLGDAFLKQAVSIFLYCCYKDGDEGKLTKRKTSQLSNRALYRVACRLGLPEYLQNTQLDRVSWTTPSLQAAEVEPVGSPGKSQKTASNKRCQSASRQPENRPEMSTLEKPETARDKALHQSIPDKSVADSVEALIGAYLTTCGYQGALHFLDWLGVKVLPESPMSTDGPRASSKYSIFTRPTITEYNSNPQVLKRFAVQLQGFENRIGYEFSNKLYLIQALTHASYSQNRLTDCYQRLEFLGDALLDFLVTELIYSRNTNLDPGELTDLRQALVNNNIFAEIAVKHGFNKSLFQMSPEWFNKIGVFVDHVKEREARGIQISKDPFLTLSNDDEEGIEAPKVLGDIFESVAGAIFLDSGMDLVLTWRVYYRMLKPYIDAYSADVPKNPVRLIHEKDADALFSEAKVLPSGKVECSLTVYWGNFQGRAANKRNAKMAASKLALSALQPSR